MCGLVGVVGDLTRKDKDAFKDLLTVDQLRGRDSTGMFQVVGSGTVEWAKAVGEPHFLYDTKSFERAFGPLGRVLAGHNRAATVGKVKHSTAHPFDFEHIIGMHNGTLRNRSKLDGPWTDVDSEQLLQHLNNGNSVQDMVDKVEGAYALVWFDRRDGTLNFVRNDERPLYTWTSDKNDLMFWASERWMLLGILARNKYTGGTVEILKEYEHVAIQATGFPYKGLQVSKRELKQPEKKTYATGSGTCTGSVAGRGSVTTYNGQKGTQTTSTGGETSEKKGEQETAARVVTIFSKTIGSAVKGKVISLLRDRHNSFYAQVECEGHVGKLFRLYSSNHIPALSELLHKRIEGICSGYDSEIGYFKISPHNFKVVEEEEIADENNGLKPDHHGRMIDRKTFESRYDSCAWCTSPLMFNTQWSAISHNDCLCEECAGDEQVMQYTRGLQ